MTQESKELLAASLEEAAKYDELHLTLPVPSQHINKAWLLAYRQCPASPMVVGAFRHNWDVNPPENPGELDAFLLRYLIGLRLYKEKAHKIETTKENLVKRLQEYLLGVFAKLPYPGFHDMSQGASTGVDAITVSSRIPLPSVTGTATITRSREISLTVQSDMIRITAFPPTEQGFKDYLRDLREEVLDTTCETLYGNVVMSAQRMNEPTDEASIRQMATQRVDQIITARTNDLRNRFMKHPSRGSV
jgi:hypothetical protein